MYRSSEHDFSPRNSGVAPWYDDFDKFVKVLHPRMRNLATGGGGVGGERFSIRIFVCWKWYRFGRHSVRYSLIWLKQHAVDFRTASVRSIGWLCSALNETIFRCCQFHTLMGNSIVWKRDGERERGKCARGGNALRMRRGKAGALQIVCLFIFILVFSVVHSLFVFTRTFVYCAYASAIALFKKYD